MTVVGRGFWLLRGRLGRVSALSRGAVSPFAAPGPAGQAFRGFRSGGVRTSREKRFHLPEVATVCLPTCPHPRSSLLTHY
ncbi:bifunctional methylenetetrahydrofolate dehydrogenase/cyclohydrolase 2, mitochondrial isoform X13 [Ovis aries]|uniref:bifunctional methylenetetrahydrofolate dehydrogenase/cyclohydrolase 2, mitochondrial isoform X13 n=1 Tax=Ovis aries TaxID=9940 RepID=UPI001C2F05BB|nr:bifunctional methylenetetrahydrofolate dehydrogenase/cyclohydrolase 2, mitochondrial isoform X13 [Ovis aries]